MTYRQQEIVQTLIALALLIAGLCCIAYVVTGISGCQSPVEATATTLTRADVAAVVTAVVAPRTEAVIAAVADTSERITETTQQALVASSRVDNSTSDKLVNRVLAIGAVVTPAAVVVLVVHWAGKLFWRRRPRARARPPPISLN